MFGLDFLGIAKYGSVAAANFPKGFALGAFSYVDGFGDALPSVEKVIKTGKCPRVRLHLCWSDSHTFGPKEFKFIEKEAKRVSKLIEKHPLIEWRISGACEHKLNKQKASDLAAMVEGNLPSWVEYVNTPLVKHGGAILPDCINELHGSEAKPIVGRFDFSFDGSNAVDSDVTAIKERMEDAETFYLWGSGANGRMTTQDTTPRAKRKAYPTPKYIQSWIALTRDRGDVKLPKGWLIKSHSDQHEVPPEERAGKPVCIIPVKAPKIEFVAKNGKVIASAPYYGPFSGGGHRYYVPEWGYLLSQKAQKISGSPIVSVRVNGKVHGTTNLAFRQGGFR